MHYSPNSSDDDGGSDQEISLSFEQEEFNRIYTNELKKKGDNNMQEPEPMEQVIDNDADHLLNHSRDQPHHSEDNENEPSKKQEFLEKLPSWYIYDHCDNLVLDSSRFSPYVLNLPIFKKKEEILNNIINNQVVLVTGETGCGKSTQVPRLLYEYIRETKLPAKIICVQPRRLAVKNLHTLLSQQIPEKGAVGYHIAMQTYIRENTKILFMTNGIFLQRLVHGTQFFEQYPFVILDQVHQRDIDTDFILLSIKRLIRLHPKLRIILMSATIDNKLFQYYFAEDQIDSFMSRENFYKRFIKIEEAAKLLEAEEEDDGFRIQRVGEEEQRYKNIQMEYLNAKLPCPTVNVTEKGKFKKQYFYLDTLGIFFQKRPFAMKSGSASFVHKYPAANKELYQDACVLLEEILTNSPRDRSNQSILAFLPGLGEIQTLSSQMNTYFGKNVNEFEIIKCHSSILNDETTRKLHHMYKDKLKIIIATNIAESSITVFGVKYVIDFCLSKEINFNQKSRMENLELVWASKASCQQRAGRTGRVCNGIVFRMVQRAFYDKLPDYSTPQIQRSSLDKLILRIKLIHENESGKIFEDPGQVLGTAIQPPNLKHIDEAIKSLIFCGGLRIQEDKLILTKLGRIYVDIPLDIIYCKMLVFSMLMGTFQDVLILVCIISQNKNAFKKFSIERNPLEFFEKMTNSQRCDFVALINAYRSRQSQQKRPMKERGVELDIYYETKLLIQDVSRRIRQRNFIKKIYPDQTKQDHQEKLKMTIAFGFLTNLIKVRPMIYDDKQEKRHKLMKKQGITVRNTVILLNSDVIRKSYEQNDTVDTRLKQNWINNIALSFRIKPQNMSITLGSGISFLHFKQETDLNKFLFVKHLEKRRGSEQMQHNSAEINKVLSHLGDIDYMEQGCAFQLSRDHKVYVDTYSSNRVVAVNKENESFQFPINRLLITNSITQHNSRLSCRYTSLLPDISNLQCILHLAFYPFVVLVPDKKRTRYDSLYLRKKSKLQVNYELGDEEIFQANRIRTIIRELMNLSLFLEQEVDFDVIEPARVTEDGRFVEENGQAQGERDENIQRTSNYSKPIGPEIPFNSNEQGNQNMIKKQQSQTALRNEERIKKMRSFWPMLKQFVVKQRRPMMQQEKWQELYFKEKQIVPKLTNIKYQRQDQSEYMNDIKTLNLQFSYFSSSYDCEIPRQVRVKQYEQWKLEKYNSIRRMEILATDHDPYLICATCQVKVARLNKVGPISHQYFRELFEYLDENVKLLVYNELGDYFCSMLMTIYMDKQYDVYGCKNGHYLAIKFRQEKKLKILTFSPISVLYADGSIEQQPQFESLQFKKWRERAQNTKSIKLKKTLPAHENTCFVCGDKFKNIKEIEAHIKNQYHQANVRDFKSIVSFPKTEQTIKASGQQEY